MNTFVVVDHRTTPATVVEIIEQAFYTEDVPDEHGEIIHHAGDPIAIGDRYHPDFVAQLVPVTDTTGVPVLNGTWNGMVFGPIPGPTPPTEAELRAEWNTTRAANLAMASSQIEWLQDAIDLEMDEPGDAELLTAWRKYRVTVNKLVYPAAFPTQPGNVTARAAKVK